MRFFVVLAVSLAGAVAGVVTSGSVLAQSAPAKNSQVPPRMPDGKPNFSGFWEAPKGLQWVGGGPVRVTIFDEAKMAPFKPGGEALMKVKKTGDVRTDEPRAFCMPMGFPWNMFNPYAVQIVQTQEYLVMVHEEGMTRIVPLDGRPHREEAEPSYYGDPVGHWEGDTLVIDTRNFKPWIMDSYFTREGVDHVRWHSDAFRTIERLQWTEPQRMSYEITVDDPKIFTRPWSEQFWMTYRPDWVKTGLYEFVCQENNRCEGGKCKPPDPAK